jgi:hypothetical protein
MVTKSKEINARFGNRQIDNHFCRISLWAKEAQNMDVAARNLFAPSCRAPSGNG